MSEKTAVWRKVELKKDWRNIDKMWFSRKIEVSRRKATITRGRRKIVER
jgi:hypothetical protein